MVWWLVDNASFVYLLLGITALALGAAWWVSRRGKYLLAAGGMVAFLVLFWLLTRLVVTDRKQIVYNIQAMARGVLDGKAEEVFRYVADEFRFEGMKRPEFTDRVARIIQQRRIHDLYLWDFGIESLARPERKARVAFRARVSGDREGFGMYLVRMDMVLEGETWKMKGFQVYNPVVDTNQPISVPLR
jgi:hypothetical protein